MEVHLRTRCLVAVLFLFTIVSVVRGVTIGSRGRVERATKSESFSNDQEFNTSFSISARQGPDPPQWLRILPLGASIVRGWGPNGVQTDGFRKALRDRLRADGYKVNMVGSQTYTGGMLDSNHEGHPGHRVDEILNDVDATAGMKPNVVLINAGTNDAQQNYDGMRGTIERLKQLVKKVQDMHPQTTIVLSTILMTTDVDADFRVQVFNKQIRQYMSGGPIGKIILADMEDGFIGAGQMQSDGIHPNEEGYRRMAAVWNKAISDAVNINHWVTEPQDNGIPDDGSGDSNCEKVPGKADGPHQTQKGYGFDDGPYRHTGTKVDIVGATVLQFPGEDAYKRILFAQIVNAGGNPDPKGVIDDMVWWRRESGIVKVDYYTNHGDGRFDYPYYTVDMPFDCPSEDVRFADINGDNMDDFLCIGSNGNVRAAVNTGSGTTVSFKDAGIHRDPGPGWQNRHVRIGDIDGDGRADYCLIGDDGVTHCWRNGGLGDTAEYWQDIGMTFAPKGKGDIKGTRFLDLNGDFRADWVWVGDKGETDIYINKRGPGPNEDRYGLVPYWQRAENFHPGMGVDGARDRVHFARLLTKDGSGRRDYAYISTGAKNPLGDTWFIKIDIWRNDGKGGTRSMSDFDRYCDVNGDGKDDYLQIRPNGDIELWLNIGNPPEWGRSGVIQNIGAIDPKSVHFVKWAGTGNKRCELLVVDKWTGAVSIRYDEGTGDRVQWGFATPLGPEYRCDQGWGVGVFDMAHHFADIDGDGRADYLCMAKDGRTFGILNGHNGPRDLGQIKFSEKKDRANHRFADVNGDGKADFLWVDKFSGEVHVWYNQGVRDSRPADGSMVQWDPKGVLYSGVDRGPNEYFLDYDGDKRADILRVNPITNWAEIWYNSCGRGTGGDDPNSNPNLPQYPPNPPPLTCPAESRPCRLNPLVCPGDLEDRYDAPVSDGEPRSRIKRSHPVDLQPRVSKDPKYWEVLGGVLAILRYVPYPSGAANYFSRYQPFGRPVLLRYILYEWGSCELNAANPTIEIVDVDRDPNGVPVVPPTGGDAVVLHSDHVWDRGLLQRFIDDAVGGRLRSGSTERLPPNPLSGLFFEAGTGLWDRNFPVLANAGSVGFNGQGPQGVGRERGSSRVAECAGSEDNMFGLVMLEEDLNLVKGRVMQNFEPYSIEETEQNQTPLREMARVGARGLHEQLLNNALTQIRLTFAVFDYLNSPDVSARFRRVIADHELEFQNLENAVSQIWRLEHPTAPTQDIVLWWRRWIEDQNALVGSNAREWVNRAVQAVREEVQAAQAQRVHDNLPPAFLHTRTLLILAAMVSDTALDAMRLPGVPPPDNDR